MFRALATAHFFERARIVRAHAHCNGIKDAIADVSSMVNTDSKIELYPKYLLTLSQYPKQVLPPADRFSGQSVQNFAQMLRISVQDLSKTLCITCPKRSLLSKTSCNIPQLFKTFAANV